MPRRVKPGRRPLSMPPAPPALSWPPPAAPISVRVAGALPLSARWGAGNALSVGFENARVTAGALCSLAIAQFLAVCSKTASQHTTAFVSHHVSVTQCSPVNTGRRQRQRYPGRKPIDDKPFALL